MTRWLSEAVCDREKKNEEEGRYICCTCLPKVPSRLPHATINLSFILPVDAPRRSAVCITTTIRSTHPQANNIWRPPPLCNAGRRKGACKTGSVFPVERRSDLVRFWEVHSMKVGEQRECRTQCMMKMTRRHELGEDGVNNCDHRPSRKLS